DLPGITVLMPRSLRNLRNASVSYPLSATSSATPGIKLTQVSATTQSAVLPGVSTNTHGRHSSSTTAWILLFRPPLVTPIACVSAPLFRRWRSDGFSHDCYRVPPAQVYHARRRPQPRGSARCPSRSSAQNGCRSSCAARTHSDNPSNDSL